MNPEYDYLLKILLIGNWGVGKSSLLLRFADDIFSDNFMLTIGMDFKIHTIEVDGKTIKLQIGTSAIKNQMKEVEKNASENISRVLVGNKSDKIDERQVTADEATELADYFNVRILETSAKDCKNVEKAFIMMAREIKSRIAIAQLKKPVPESGGSSVDTTLKNTGQSKKLQDNKKGRCC